MPDITIPHIVMLTVMALAGLLLGWLARGRHAAQEKLSINIGWKEQLDAKHTELKRLVEQNRVLGEQASQSQAAHKDATNRARELAAALKEAFERRDELQRQIKEIRGSLEGVLVERRKLESEVRDFAQSDSHLSAELKDKDEKIFHLSRELESWQDRLPPLIQRFRDRDDDARRLEAELDRANERIMELETGRTFEHTHVETVHRDTSAAEFEASNDALGSRSGLYTAPGLGLGNSSPAVEPSGHYEVDAAVMDDAGDDLQAIKGVGPAIEKTLHELGIFRFSQIAEMSEFDIHRVAEHLKGFRTRIYREDWIGQARELQYRRGRRTH
jgi:hypothetical protein